MTNGQSALPWSERFPELCGGVLGNYFHQTWRALYATRQAALRDYVEHQPHEDLRAALGEVETLLSLRLDERQLERILADELALTSCRLTPATPMSGGWKRWFGS
jgi:hypothetical protein